MSWAPRPVPAPRGWVVLRHLVLAGTGGLALALLLAPRETNRIFWFALVPVLPILFLVNAELWRNVCPVATLSTLFGEGRTIRPLEAVRARRMAAFGIGLFLLLVPLRRLLFDVSGQATFGLVAAAAGAAFLGGLRLDRKAGFCNAFCPILPIERLYGQRPLVSVPNARCGPCRACTEHACFDLNPERSGLVSLGPDAASRRWVTTPFGAFALALPGYVVGFYLAPDASTDPSAAVVYATVLGCAAVSWGALAAAALAASVRPAVALVGAAGLAAGAYYWFTPAVVAGAWNLDPGWATGLRVPTLSIVAFWTLRGWRRTPDGAPTRGGR